VAIERVTTRTVRKRMEKIMGDDKFFKLNKTNAQALIKANLSQKAMKLWLYLITQSPSGDWEELLIFEVIERDLGFKKDTFYRAKAELHKKGLFEFAESRTTFKSNLSDEVATNTTKLSDLNN
jgi:hypothetical protein